MNIQQQDDSHSGSFYIKEEGEELALMTYKWKSPNIIVIEHTEVNEKLEGKEIGKQLVNKAVEFAREKQAKILPLCTFAKAVIAKTPEYQDVLK